MGPALAFAFTAPTALALAVFLALGLGLALPFLLIGWVPALARLLPRPGAWMDTFKQLLAFPMYLTAVWLLWVLAKQRGAEEAHRLTREHGHLRVWFSTEWAAVVRAISSCDNGVSLSMSPFHAF